MGNSTETIRLRHRAAEAARDYLARKISWDEFMREFEEIEDIPIAVLVDLIEHEPKRGDFLGLSEKEWEHYQSQLILAIEALTE
jgi:hypothetical protein